MNDKWMIRGVQFVNCNCAWGCPCQFGAKSTHGFCEGFNVGHIEEGYFNDTKLDGLNWIAIAKFPGEISEGNGCVRRLSTSAPTAFNARRWVKSCAENQPRRVRTHFYIFNSMASEVLDPLYAPLEVTIDVDARQASAIAPGLVEAKGTPIIDAFSQKPVRARINLPDGFEYTVAEMGTGTSKITAGLTLEFKESYGQFSIIHMNQDGVIR